MESKILLESGTNELELLVFEVGGNKYGINVAKVREIRPSEPVTIIHIPILKEFSCREM